MTTGGARSAGVFEGFNLFETFQDRDYQRSGGRSLVLSATDGTFALTGEPTVMSRTMPMACGLFFLTGFQVLFSDGMPTLAGSFSETGQEVTFKVTRLLDVDRGSFVLTGESVVLQRSISAEHGSFVEIGEDVVTRVTHIIDVGYGAFSETGQDVILRKNGTLFADRGSFVEIGEAAVLSLSHIVLSGGDAGSVLICGGKPFDPFWAEPTAAGLIGDGSDGDAVLNSDSDIVTNKYFNNLTITNNATVTLGSIPLRVLNILRIEDGSCLSADGDDAAWEIHGDGLLAVISGASGDGGDGGFSGPGTSAPSWDAQWSLGGLGGAGGDAHFGVGGAGGAILPLPGAYNMMRTTPWGLVGMVPFSGSYGHPASMVGLLGGSGGGGGGGGGIFEPGGGGAGGGGTMHISCRLLVALGLLPIRARGGRGGDGTFVAPPFGGAGGGGGGGGYIGLGYVFAAPHSLSSSSCCAGGKGGAGFSGGTDGQSGTSGQLIIIPLGP